MPQAPKATPAKKTNPKATKAAPAKKAPARQKAKTAPIQPTIKQRLDAIGEAAVIERISDGESYRQIAASLGVPKSKLVEWLHETPDRSRACACAREEAADSYDEMALEELRSADRENITVAREIASHLRWRAKAANPKRYSDKLQLDATVETKIVGDAELLAGLAKLGLTAKVNGPD